MTTLLVTGAAGFIGSAFVRHWVAEHPDDLVVALDALTYAGNLANLDPVKDRITFVHADIRDTATVADALRDNRVDAVVNFAAESHNSLAILRPGEFFSTNVMGTQSLLEASRHVGVARFHHVSTCEVYGDMDLDEEQGFTEDSPYLPRTPYNASKAGGDHAVRSYGLTYDLPYTITNCANNYGPYQFPEKVVPLFVTRALRGEDLPMYASTQNRREWIHVDDHCRAIELVLLSGTEGETYHVGTGVEKSIEEIADAVIAATGISPDRKVIVPDRPSHDRRYLLDSSKIARELGWKAEIPFERGLEATIDWYKANEAWWAPLLDRAPVQESTAWTTFSGR